MAANPNSNGGGQYYRRQIYAQSAGPASATSGNLPPASELLSPTMPYPSKVRHPMHSVASPSIGPPSPYLGTGHNNYQALTEPGTPAFLNPASNPTPSPSYESIASPASNNHVNQSAGSTKPSTPMAECRASPIPNGIYNAPTPHYPPPSHYYQQPHQQYQRLPSVDTLPSPSNYYPNSSGQIPPPNQASAHHSNVYIRPVERMQQPVTPGTYMTPSTPTAEVYPSAEEINGIQDYYPDPYTQTADSQSTYNSHYPPQQYGRAYPATQTTVMKQPGQPQQLQRTPSLQRQVVYQQYPMGVPSHQVVNIYDGTVVEQRPPVPYVPPQAGLPPNGTSVQQKIISDGVVTNATQPPIMSAAPLNTQPTNMDESGAAKTEKPKKPPPKRIRKSAAQLKAEAAAKAEQQQQTNAQKELQVNASGQKPNGDSDTSMMPPPKVAEAPSVVAAASKAMHNAVGSQNNTPQKPEQKPSPQHTAPIVGHEATQLGANVAELPNQQQQAGPPKRQRTASQRAQQQKVRIQKQKELEMLKKIEDREYLIKLMQLRRTVRALVFKNGALADEVARLKMQIDICREERKMVAKRVQHYERNRIRRLQTHERKAMARAAAAQQQDTVEEDENSKSIDVVLPLNDIQSSETRPMPTNFQSMQEVDPISAVIDSMQKSRTPTQTPRKRSRSSKEPGEQAPAKRRKSNGTASTTPMETSPVASQKQSVIIQQPITTEVLVSPAEDSHSPSPTTKQLKRPTARPGKKTPPSTNTAEDAISLRTRTVSISLATNPLTTPSRQEFTRFPTNFLERAETPGDKMEEPRESDFDRPPSEQPTPASKLPNDRHLRSNSSTTDGGAETRQRTNSRASRRPPRHSLTPSSMADSDVIPSNSASPIPATSTEGTPTNTPTVVTRRRAAEIATSSTTPPMKTRSKSKMQGS